MSTEAILYAAKSTVDRHGSIPDQLKDGRALAGKLGLSVVGEYTDEDISGYHHDRGPGLAAALAHAEQASATLIVQHTDRLSRGDGVRARHLAELYFWAQKTGVTIRSCQDDSTFENPIMAVVMGERNAEDSRRKGLAVTAGMRRRFERGLPNGGRRPYGYNLINTAEERSLYEINPAEAAIVKRIFTEADNGRSNMTIARDLERDGVKTQRGGYWRASTVNSVLSNPVYIGQVTFRKEVGPGIHQPIIPLDQWQRIRALREQRRKGSGKGRGRPTAGSHLFTRGFLRCSCGDAMAPRTQRNRTPGSVREIYFCLRHWQHPDRCAQQPVDRATIDLAVYHYFQQVGLDLDSTRQALHTENHRKQAEVDALLDQARREVQRTEESLTRVRRDYTDGHLTASDWQDLRDQLATERDAAIAQVQQLTSRRDTLTEGKAAIDTETVLVQRLTEIRAAIAGQIRGAKDLDAVRAALRRTFQGFLLVNRPTGPVPADLAWLDESNLMIQPIVSQDTIATLTDHGLELPASTPLALTVTPKTNDRKASRHVICFDPIPIGGAR